MSKKVNIIRVSSKIYCDILKVEKEIAMDIKDSLNGVAGSGYSQTCPSVTYSADDKLFEGFTPEDFQKLFEVLDKRDCEIRYGNSQEWFTVLGPVYAAVYA